MIVTVDEVKTHLRIQHDEEDDYIESLIKQAQTAAEDYCRVQFEPSQRLSLFVWPSCSSSAITTKTGITRIGPYTPPCALPLKTCSIPTAIP